MIYSLHGTIELKLATAMVINVNNVGYFVQCTIETINNHQLKDTIDLIIYHHFREDNQMLFGFESTHERDLFETLISVSGIGPKVALNKYHFLANPFFLAFVRIGI